MNSPRCFLLYHEKNGYNIQKNIVKLFIVSQISSENGVNIVIQSKYSRVFHNSASILIAFYFYKVQCINEDEIHDKRYFQQRKYFSYLIQLVKYWNALQVLIEREKSFTLYVVEAPFRTWNTNANDSMNL